ncbi:MAG: hypothetical protein MK078_14015 [Crocinitomicaceae bacterium]|nr:hypothetical protein [Crocinitomicaceae bacterium]
MKYLLTFFSFILLFSSFGQDNTWEKRADFGALKRERAVSFSIGDYGYVGTGTDTAEVVHADLWRFDPSTNSWSQMSDMPASVRRNAVGFAIEDKGYIGTGVDNDVASLGTILDDFWEYNPDLNSWTQKADYPGGGGFGVYHATGFAIDDKGFICAGKIGPSNYVFDLWEYDPDLDTWTARTSFPGSVRYQLSSFVVEGKAYVGMGVDYDIFRRDWWEYDPTTFVWSSKADLPGSERGAASTFTLGQRGFVVFGTDGGFKNELWEYNPFTDSWNIKAPFPTAGRKGAVAFAIGDTAYAGIGKGNTGKKKSFYAYVPGVVSTNENKFIHSRVYPNPIKETFAVEADPLLVNGQFSFYNAGGQLIWNGIIDSETMTLERNNMASGYYTLILSNPEQEVTVTKTLMFE